MHALSTPTPQPPAFVLRCRRRAAAHKFADARVEIILSYFDDTSKYGTIFDCPGRSYCRCTHHRVYLVYAFEICAHRAQGQFLHVLARAGIFLVFRDDYREPKSRHIFPREHRSHHPSLAPKNTTRAVIAFDAVSNGGLI